MVDEREARQRFSELMARDDADIELDRAALTIAQGEYEWLDAEKYRGRLDEMATELRPRLSPEDAAERLVAEINAYLFGEESFHGNAGNYYDPRNSYLNDVLDRRTGIPITLSLVYIEVARRAHLRIEGIGLPGHFIVRCHGSRDDLLIDTFNQGAILTIEDCAALVRELYGQSLAFTGELLRPASNREIVARILGNLKGSYLRRGDLPRALQAVEWGLIADPARADDRREKGLLRYRLGDLRGAAEDLEHYLEQRPEGVLADETRAQLRHVHQLWARRN
jgi:regulator of sirC expression with transglutaminase-like and TPR domain